LRAASSKRPSPENRTVRGSFKIDDIQLETLITGELGCPVTDLDNTDLHAIAVALLWIRRHRELHRQPPSAAIERALDHLTSTLAANGQGAEPNPRDLLTTAEVAKRVGCSKRHALRIAQRLGARVGRQWLTPAELVED
jgi:hypothetical protein